MEALQVARNFFPRCKTFAAIVFNFVAIVDQANLKKRSARKQFLWSVRTNRIVPAVQQKFLAMNDDGLKNLGWKSV